MYSFDWSKLTTLVNRLFNYLKLFKLKLSYNYNIDWLSQNSFTSSPTNTLNHIAVGNISVIILLFVIPRSYCTVLTNCRLGFCPPSIISSVFIFSGQCSSGRPMQCNMWKICFRAPSLVSALTYLSLSLHLKRSGVIQNPKEHYYLSQQSAFAFVVCHLSNSKNREFTIKANYAISISKYRSTAT